jgi:hypothetical protein
MIAAPVQGDVDGIPKGSHFESVPPMGRFYKRGIRIVRAVAAKDELLGKPAFSAAFYGPAFSRER